jgi:hypothetical protein
MVSFRFLHALTDDTIISQLPKSGPSQLPLRADCVEKVGAGSVAD